MGLFKKNGFSAKQSKSTSRRMNQSMYGTHHSASNSPYSGLGSGSQLGSQSSAQSGSQQGSRNGARSSARSGAHASTRTGAHASTRTGAHANARTSAQASSRTSTRASARTDERASARTSAHASARTGSPSVRSGKRSVGVTPEVHFASSRRSRRAEKGVISTLSPSTSSRETNRSFERRMKGNSFAAEHLRSSKRRSTSTLVISIIIALAVAAVVAVNVFHGSIQGRMAVDGSGVKNVLVSEPATGGYYVLIAADLGTPSNRNQGLYVLAHIDEEQGTVAYEALPQSARVRLSDGEYHQICQAVSIDGMAGLVTAAFELTGAPISHLIYSDAEKLVGLVDSLGGIQIEVPREVDDPAAGNDYIQAGVQTLSGDKLLTFLRAKNYTNGVEDQAACQGLVVAEILRNLCGASSVGALFQLDNIANYLSTDWSTNALMKTQENLSAVKNLTILGCVATGWTGADKAYYILDEKVLAANKEALDEGVVPTDEGDDDVVVDKQSFTITVKNGGGVTGAAGTVAETLTGMGYRVEATGNAESYVYTETLVIYLDDAFAPAARAVCKDLGVGRVLDGTSFYSFDTDVLVMVGADWKPLN